jgi:hypothetical protein
VASPTEVWLLDTAASRLRIWRASGETFTDLSRPGRFRVLSSKYLHRGR